MDTNTKQMWLNRIKQGKVAVIESPYAPQNNTNCVWLKDGNLYVCGNSGWEVLSSGGGDDPRLVPPTSYPFEVPYSAIESSSIEYEDTEGLLNFTYIQEDLVYVIGKSGSYYTLIGTLDAQDRSIWGSLLDTDTESYDFYSGIINSQSTSIGKCKKSNDSNFFVAISDSLPQYDSVVFDTEYNTDKYPEEPFNPEPPMA